MVDILNGALVRIILRYLSGVSGGTGLQAAYFGTDVAGFSPDMVVVMSAMVAGVVELYYWLAKRNGWPT